MFLHLAHEPRKAIVVTAQVLVRVRVRVRVRVKGHRCDRAGPRGSITGWIRVVFNRVGSGFELGVD